MGNLNFQDDQDENQEQNPNQNPNQNQDQNPDQDQSQNESQPVFPEEREPRIDEGYIDDPTAGTSKILWIAIIVVVIAGIGGALYMLHRSGYLKFPIKKKPAVTTTTRTTPPPPVTKSARQQRPTPAPSKPSVKPQGNFALQVSAFRTRAQAQRDVASLRKKGIDGRVIVAQGGGGEKWFRVVTGSYGTKLKAIAQLHSMKRKVGTDVWVVPEQ